MDDINQLDSIDSTLAAGASGKEKGKSSNPKRKYKDITGISSGKKDKDEEDMMKDFGDVSMSDHDGSDADSAGSSAAADDDNLENLDAELGDAKPAK